MRPGRHSPLFHAIQLRKKRAELREVLMGLALRIFLAVVFMAVLFTQVFGLAVMKGNDMYPAVRDGDVLLYYRNGDLMNSEAVLYEADGSLHVGRIEAVNGAVIGRTGDDQLTIDGNLQPVQARSGIYSKTYTASEGGIALPLTVGEDEYFILSDDRTRTEDSRIYGAIPKASIRGRVITILRRRVI